MVPLSGIALCLAYCMETSQLQAYTCTHTHTRENPSSLLKSPVLNADPALYKKPGGNNNVSLSFQAVSETETVFFQGHLTSAFFYIVDFYTYRFLCFKCMYGGADTEVWVALICVHVLYHRRHKLQESAQLQHIKQAAAITVLHHLRLHHAHFARYS